MRRIVAGIVHSRILPILALIFLMISQGGAAHQIRGGTVPGAVAAAYPHSEPSRDYSSDAAYGEECLNCHAPVGCLAANRCQDCHLELARAQACTQAQAYTETTEEAAGMPPDGSTYQISQIAPPEQDEPDCDAPQAAVDHEQLSGFSLDRHQTGFDGEPLTCESCHPAGLYDSDSVACAGCHAEEAPAAMAEHTADYGDGCAGCHDGQGGHSRLEAEEAHALGGAHREAGCQDCHTGSSLTDGVRDCSDCHEEPEAHAGQAGLRCDWCHTAVSWTPARLMEHSFRLDHGDLDPENCGACHTGTYEHYSCSGCHEHQPAELQERHAQEGIEQLEPCGRCHPTGVQGEAGRLGHGQGGQTGNPEAPGPNTGGQAPTGGEEPGSPGQEGGEQVGPEEQNEGLKGPEEEPTASEGSATEPTEATAGGALEEPVGSTPGSTGVLSGEQDQAQTAPSSTGADDALAPGALPGGQAAGE